MNPPGQVAFPLMVSRLFASQGERFRLHVGAGLTPFARTDADAATTIRQSILHIAAENHGHLLHASLGGGLTSDWILGTGGTIQLRNGSKTSSFYSPGRLIGVHQFFLSPGVGLATDLIRFDVGVAWTQPFSTPNRATHLWTQLSFGFF